MRTIPIAICLLLCGCSGGDDGPPPPSAEEVILHAARTADTGSLVLSEMGVTDDVLRAVLADPRVPALRSVTLHQNRLTAEAVSILEAAPQLQGVEWLNVSGNQLGDPGVSALTRSPLMKGVQRLFISGNGAGPEGLAALAQAPALIFLAAGDQPLGDAGASTLAGLERLTRIEVPRAGIGGAGARQLLEQTNARVLVLEGNPIGPGGLTGLTQISPHLEELTLDACALTEADVRALAAVPEPESLTLLELSGNPELGDAGVAALAELPWIRSLEKIVVMESGAALEHRQAVVDAWGVRSGIKIERR